MSDNLISFLREHGNGNNIELNECIALISKYFIEGGDGIEDFPKFEKELKKFTSINSKRSEVEILALWWSQYSDQQKQLFIGHQFSIANGMVTIPEEVKTIPQIDIPFNSLFDVLEHLYDVLVQNRGGDDKVSSYKYIWQWKITSQEYDAICKFVEICRCFDRNDKSKLISGSHYKSIFIIVAYIAERYKREWNGNDGEENALIQIGLEDKAKQIARAYFRDRSDTHIFRHNNGTGPHEYLESLRMEGGLPVKYIVKHINGVDGNNNHLVDFCEKLYEDSTEALNILNSRINNSCLRYSYERQHSIYHYVSALLEDNAIANIYGSDAENVEQIKTFAELLLNGRERAQRKSHKFAMEYSVWRWKGTGEFVMHQNVVFKADSSFNETQDLISRARLEQWGINPSYIFWLKIGNRAVEFHPWRNDFYRPATGNTRIQLDDVDLSSPSLPKISFGYIGQGADGKRDMDHIRTITRTLVPHKDPYIKFSSEDGHKWIQNGNGAFSAVLIVSPADVEGIYEELELEGGMRWIEYSGQLKINGQHIYSSNNIIIPKPEASHSIATQTWIRNIQLLSDGTAEPIHILNPSKVIAKNFNKVDCNGTTSRIVGTIEYKNNDTNRFTNFDCSNPPLGLTTLRMDGIRMKAYLYPEDTRFIRDIGHNFVSLKGIEAEQVEIQGDSSFYTVNPTGDWKAFDRYHPDNKQADSISIIIHNEDDTDIAMEIIRPLKQKDRILSSMVLDSNQQIPKRLASQFRVREFNEDGVTYHKDRACVQKYSNRQIQLQRIQQNGYYIIANGRDVAIEDNLHFAFWAVDGTMHELSVKSDNLDFCRKDIVYYYLTGIPKNTAGCIIQTLKYGKPKLTFYKPLWIGENTTAAKFRQSVPHLQRFLGCLEHGLYFDDFFVKADFERQPLTRSYLPLEDLLRQYVKYCVNESIDIDYRALWEIAGNFNKDWMLTPRPHWKEMTRVDRIEDNIVRNIISWLLLLRPEDNKCTQKEKILYVANFWDYKWTQRTNRRSSVEKIFLRYIMNGEPTNECPLPTTLPKMTDILSEMLKD